MAHARENPFRSTCLERLAYRLPGGTWDEYWARLATLGYRAAIVGPEGTGKTTLLEHLARSLPTRGFRVHLLRAWPGHGYALPYRVADKTTPRDTPWPPADLVLDARDLLLLDSAEQLSFLAWRRFRRQVANAGGLIITTHRAGRLPTWVRTRPTPALLADLVAELLGTPIWPGDDSPAALFAQHHGDLRACLRALYDRHA